MARRDPNIRCLLVMGGIFFLVAVLLYNSSERVTRYIPGSQENKVQAPPNSLVSTGAQGLDNPMADPSGPTSGLAETVIPSGHFPGDSSRRQKAHVDGFTVLDQLYLRSGTFYAVTRDPNFPKIRAIIGKWDSLGQDNTPTDKEMQIVTLEQAPEILGEFQTRVSGFTVFVYDPAEFMHHYYHWWGEIILGMWRVYSALRLGSEPTDPKSYLPFPSRFILPAIEGDEWRDRAGVDGPLMRAAFPLASIEKADYWKDLVKMNTTVVFDRAMIINRDTAHRHPFGAKWFKMIAGTMNVTVPDYFWEPVRHSTLRNVLGYVPRVDSRGRVLQASLKPDFAHGILDDEYDLPVVTYISRQGAGRRLRDEDHLSLVEALTQLEAEGLCKFQMPMMERLPIREQMAIMATTTILVGVHGNGLTHQMNMPPSLRSAVFEIFDPPGYTFDYEFLARNMGHKHYGVHNDTLVTFPKGTYHEGVNFPPGFQGNSIPVYGPVIADKIRQRLTQPNEDVEQ